MKYRQPRLSVFGVVVVVFVVTGMMLLGCEQPNGSIDTEHATADHNHDHEHEHFHAKALYGGHVVAIGHTHGKDATDYHAEIMPIRDAQITFHVLGSNARHASQPLHVKAETILAYAAGANQKTGQASKIIFSPTTNSGGSTWSAAIPASLKRESQLAVVIPKITLAGKRLNFSFKTSEAVQQTQSKRSTAEDSK